MLPFDFKLPTRIYFGVGRLNEIGKLLKPVGNKALIVTGISAMRKLGVLDKSIR
jgi:alcohol dehydrogenase YqhD (iron-dependent ADH family)